MSLNYKYEQETNDPLVANFVEIMMEGKMILKNHSFEDKFEYLLCDVDIDLRYKNISFEELINIH